MFPILLTTPNYASKIANMYINTSDGSICAGDYGANNVYTCSAGGIFRLNRWYTIGFSIFVPGTWQVYFHNRRILDWTSGTANVYKIKNKFVLFGGSYGNGTQAVSRVKLYNVTLNQNDMLSEMAYPPSN